MNVLQQLAAVTKQIVAKDGRYVVLGEDVLDGGMLGLTRLIAADPELAPRLVATPLTPSVCFAHAGGLAAGGARPIVVLASTTALLEGLAGLREACLLPWRTAGSRRCPLLIVAPHGPGFSLGADAGDGVEAIAATLPGLRILVASSAELAGALLEDAAAMADQEGPTLLLLPRALLLTELGPTPQDEPPTVAGHARVVRDGAAATVFAWGASVGLALAAVERAGIDAAVVDVASLAPLDREGLLAAARATGKIVIVHGNDRGVASELAALFADQAILTLDAPVTRVGGNDGPVSPANEGTALPGVDRIATAIRSVAEY